MSSRRRISILAGSLLIVSAALAGYFVFRSLRDAVDDTKRTAYKAPLVISVEAIYPGANAQIVADTLAAPIEQQVNGVEGMLHMSSQSASDGSYTLHVTFGPRTDLNIAQVLVQNRVSLAMPALPTVVQQAGVFVRKKAPEPLVLVSLTSPDNRFDERYLSNYATIQIKDELARLVGVGDIVPFGRRDQRMRLTLDADKLAARELSATDVITAISQQNIQVAGGAIGQAPVPKGQPLQLTINTLGRLTEAEELERVVVKATADGRMVRLKDVARIEQGRPEGSTAKINGQPAVLLGIHPLPNAKPSEVSRAVLDKLVELRAGVPAGLSLAVAFDLRALLLEDPNNPATPEHLVIDVQLPDAASMERISATLDRTAQIVQNTPGVQEVLALTEHPFSLVRNRPCLVVGLTPKDQRELGRGQIAEKVRVALETQIPEALFRLSVPSTAEGFPLYGFPIEFAVEDRGDHGSEFLKEHGEALARQMNESGKFSAAGIGTGLRSVTSLNLEIDRPRCQALGLEIGDIFNTLQANLGSCYVNDFNRFGRTWQVNVQADANCRARTTDILRLQVKSKEMQLVPLSAVLNVRDTRGPLVIERHNLYPIVRITANLAEGISFAEAKSLCETLAEQEFGTKQFKLIWWGR